MAVNFNGTQVSKVFWNGIEVNKVFWNGSEVFSKDVTLQTVDINNFDASPEMTDNFYQDLNNLTSPVDKIIYILPTGSSIQSITVTNGYSYVFDINGLAVNGDYNPEYIQPDGVNDMSIEITNLNNPICTLHAPWGQEEGVYCYVYGNEVHISYNPVVAGHGFSMTLDTISVKIKYK